MLLIKLCKLFFHSCRTGNNIWSISFSNFEYFCQSFLLLLKDLVNLIYGDEFAVIKFEISSLWSIHKWFWHGYNDISEIMHLFIKAAYFEIELLWALSNSELSIGIEDSLELILKNIGLHYNDSLRFEDFVFHYFSFATLNYSYKLLSSAVWSPGYRELRMGIMKDIVLPEPLAALTRILNFLRSGFTVTSRV